MPTLHFQVHPVATANVLFKDATATWDKLASGYSQSAGKLMCNKLDF
jgi:hypothetical protein